VQGGCGGSYSLSSESAGRERGLGARPGGGPELSWADALGVCADRVLQCVQGGCGGSYSLCSASAGPKRARARSADGPLAAYERADAPNEDAA
jgi:hypothetical protein